MDEFQDRELECVDCPKGKTFTFSADEQKFFKSKGFEDPKRCLTHRKLRKQQKLQEGENRGRNH